MAKSPGHRSGQPRLQWDGRRDQDDVAAAELRLAEEVYPPSAAGAVRDRRLIAGDNLPVMAALLPEFEARCDLIYVDPPFGSGKAYAARVGGREDSRLPESWETTDGFGDRWDSTADYLNMLAPRLRLMYRLLAPTGTLYLHLDWRASAYARLLLDEIFGPERLLNEIIWVYHGPSPIRRAFKRKHDTLLVYTKSTDYTFNADAVRLPYNPATVRTFASSPRAGFGKKPDLARGKVPEDWWYLPVVARMHSERTGYPTQKPESLLDRVISASSNPGDLVADFFCGSGTTVAVAGRLGRRWIGCDIEPLAVHTTQRRLLLEPSSQAFSLFVQADVAPAFRVRAEIATHGDEVSIRLPAKRWPKDESRDAGDIQFWEVDWDYDGQVFRSRAQAVRGWRQDELPLNFRWPGVGRRPRRVAVRAVDREGRVGWCQIDCTDAGRVGRA